jgi:hypothetical protein
MKKPCIWHVVLLPNMGPANLKTSSEGMGSVVKAIQLDAIISKTLIKAMIR